ncbi:MAG: hypothetical protein WA783_01280 [Phormidesmis sp.]
MESLKVIELKFLLKLLGCEGYRGKMKDLSPNGKTKASERDRICMALGTEDIVEYDSQVARFSLTSPGRTLLGLDTTSLPVTPDELKVLQACQKAKGSTTPGTITGVSADSRQGLIRSLTERGMLKINKEDIKEAWLTDKGKQFLLYEYEPVGSYASTASATMLGNYVRFLRENLGQPESQPESQLKSQPRGLPTGQPIQQASSAIPIGSQTKPDRQAVLQQIKQLDQQVGNKNYLPIFHLRDALQPPLSRSELDSILYALQREGQVDLSSLHDQGKYTPEQMSAGIRQDNGGYLFFVSIL